MKKRIVAIICAVALAVGCVAALSGCDNKKVAATVNGTPIYEDDVTKYIESFRKSYNLTEESAWGEWMSTYGYTPETVRSAVIDSFVEAEVIKAAAKEEGVTVDSSQVDTYVSQMKAYYDSEEAWKNALSSAGMTEEEYREQIEESLLEQALMDKVSPMTEPSSDTMLTYAKMYSSYYDGAKRSSHILFASSDTEKAQQVLDQIKSGSLSFEDAVKQYSTDTASAANTPAGDVGWDVLNTFVTEYTNALSALSKDEMSGLVTSTYGIHIIKCTDVFTAPAEITSADQLPQAFLDSISGVVKSSEQQTKFSTWLSDYKGKATIEIKDMPSGLSYNIDMSKYTNTSNNSAANNSNSNSNTNSNSNANSNTNQ